MSNKKNNKKLSKLGGNDDNYIKPAVTISDRYTPEEIKNMLEDYERTDCAKLKKGFHIRYFKKVNDNLEFKPGGYVFDISGAPEYIIITNGKFNWSAQCNECIFYQKMTFSEEKTQLDETIKLLEQQNKQKDTQIVELTALAKKYKSDIAKHEKLIKKLQKQLNN
jgi:hypothetical protein